MSKLITTKSNHLSPSNISKLLLLFKLVVRCIDSAIRMNLQFKVCKIIIVTTVSNEWLHFYGEFLQIFVFWGTMHATFFHAFQWSSCVK